MFCWQVRRSLSDALDGEAPFSLEAHLASCESCRSLRDDLGRVSALVRESAGLPPSVAGRIALDAGSFEMRVMTRLRERRAGISSGPLADPLGASSTPVPMQWGAAAALMVLVTVLAIFIGNGRTPDTSGPRHGAVAESRLPEADQRLDAILPPQEIPFVVKDLEGARSGRLPATIYVLEPAPREETAVMRASF